MEYDYAFNELLAEISKLFGNDFRENIESEEWL